MAEGNLDFSLDALAHNLVSVFFAVRRFSFCCVLWIETQFASTENLAFCIFIHNPLNKIQPLLLKKEEAIMLSAYITQFPHDESVSKNSGS
jgi:uncharacterized membrane protein